MVKQLAFCLTALGILAVTSACSSGGNSSANENAALPERIQNNEKKDPVEIVFYPANGDNEATFNNLFGNDIRKKFPDYDIKFVPNAKGTKIPELLASGTRIDIAYAGIGSYETNTVPYALNYDMTELIKKHNVNLASFEPTMIDSIRETNNGKIPSLPVYGNNLILYYNKSIFDKFGVKYPRDGMTWKETMETARLLTRMEDNVQYAGFGFTPAIQMRFNPLPLPTANLQTNTPTINTNDLWKRFFQTFFVDPQPSPGLLQTTGNNTAFAKDQRLAMFAYISSLITLWAEELKLLDWDIVSLPSFDDMPGFGSQINSTNFGITSIAKQKDEAMEVIAFLVSEEFQTKLARNGTMPVLSSEKVRSQLGQDSPHKDKNFRAIFYNKPLPVPPKALYDLELVNVYAKYGTQVWQGKTDINTALRQAEEEAKQTIETFMNNMPKANK